MMKENPNSNSSLKIVMRKLNSLFLLFLIITFIPSTILGGPIEDLKPGEWYEVPNSHLSAVLPDPIPPGSPKSIMGAWSGGAYDTNRDRLIIWGGGHNDYGGNEIYAFDINTLSWSRIWGPSANIPGTGGSCNEAYSDGNPASRHTYEGLEYIPTTDKFWSQGGSLYCGSGGSSWATWEFDLKTLTWNRTNDAPSTKLGVVSAYDPVTGHVFQQGYRKFSEYDPLTGTYTVVGNEPSAGWSGDAMAADIDFEKRLFVAVGDGHTRLWDLNTRQYSEIITTGGSAVVNAEGPGLAYDPVSKKFVGWFGGADVYTLDTDSRVWTRHPPAATNTVIPTSAAQLSSGFITRGTYGKFRYIPSRNSFIVVNTINENVYIYKLSEGGSTTDTISPTVSITSPSSGSTVSNSIAVSVTAADNVGVVGIQFKLDGANLGTEDTDSPYSITWDTIQASNASHTISAVARDAAGNTATSASVTITVSNTVQPPPPPPTGQIDIPLNTWVAIPSPQAGKGPSPSGEFAGSKHMRLTHNPIDGRIYFLGGDYHGPNASASGRQEIYSYSIKDNNWILEHPYCDPDGNLQPKHPDEVGWIYDTTRDIFWMLPGVTISFPATNCESTLVKDEIFTFDPVTKKWSWPDRAESNVFTENNKFASYDPVSDTIIMLYQNTGAAIYDIKTDMWEYLDFGDLFLGNGYQAIDIEGRVIYVIHQSLGKLYRYNIDTKTANVLIDTPAETTTGRRSVAMPVWDSVNKVLLWPQIFDDPGVITMYVYHPDTNQWEKPSMNQPDGLLVQGNSAVFDPYQNILFVMGGVAWTAEDPIPQHFFLYRYHSGTVDPTPPSIPQALNANAINDNQIDLTWQASSDPESGISKYNIYRDGANIGQSTTTSFSDIGLNEGTTYNYEVSAVNGAGLESAKSAFTSATTFADTVPPTISSVSTSGDPAQVTVIFSEAVEQISAEDIFNYNIDNGITVSTASLGADLKTVTLTTDSHSEGISYTLTVNNIRDRASNPNVITANTTATYTFVSQLVISNLNVANGKNYEIVQDGLTNSAVVYIDRTFTYSGVPASVEGATYIKTANDDKALTGNAFLSFDVNQDVTVYVAHDNRITVKPSWMTSFTDTGEDLVTTDTTSSLFSKDYAAGTITLGGNEGGGNGMYSVVVVGMGGVTPPPPDTTPPVISNIQVSAIQPDSATITWTTDEAADSEVLYGLDTSYGSNVSDAAFVTTHSLQITGLTPETLYHYQIVSKDASGNKGASVDSTFTTLPVDTEAPSDPTNLTATPMSSSDVNLSWTASTDNIGVTGYNIYRDGIQMATSTTTSYSDTNLQPDTTYIYTVTAFDAAGNISPQSQSMSATTLSGGTSGGNIISANPSDYLSLLPTLQPGDTLLLAPGTYSANGLPLFNINGTPTNPITIKGPDSGSNAIILGNSGKNTVRIDGSSYLTIKNLEIDGRDLGVDGVNFQGTSHHVTLDNLLVKGVGDHQLTVGISANQAPTWDITVRNSTIIGAGTGIYFGNSDGNEQFVNGLIENNLFMDTIGYNMQIKHQNPRPAIEGMPTTQSKTIIRHNVFSKANQPTSGYIGARPNVLVGHLPLSGPGMDDVYEIYGNFFYQNLTGEPLFQGEGNIALYDNLFVNNDGEGIWIQAHNDVPRMIRIFNNTVLSRDRGILITGGSPSFEQKVIGNAVFSQNPIQANDQQDNIIDTYLAASNYLINPTGTLEAGTLDLFPKVGMLTGTLLNTNSFNNFTDWNLDFNLDFHTGIFRGAYTGEGQNPGWIPKLEKKILGTLPVDTTAPTTPQSLNAIAQNDNQIDLTWQASSDPESGISKYNIYRDGANIGQSTATSFSDIGLAEGTMYTYEVSAVNGAGLESAKSIPVSVSTLADTTPPTITSASINSAPTQVTVVFSEPIEQISAENTSNYVINNGVITISAALLGSDLKTVNLTTSQHSEGITYTLTVNNINDRASVPNVIASNTQSTYTFVTQLIISNLTVQSGQNYGVVQDGLQTGAVVYIDRSFTYSSVPASLQGATYIKTANNDKGSTGDSFLTFDVNQAVTVLVAHDNRTTPKPSWLSSFSDTGEDIVTTDTNMSIFVKEYPAGTIALGGNEGSGSMYTVIIKGSGGTSVDTAPPAPPTGLIIIE